MGNDLKIFEIKEDTTKEDTYKEITGYFASVTKYWQDRLDDEARYSD